MAENTIHTLHNLYTLRGAEVRDAKAWSHYINEAIEIFSDDAQVLFASHTWPIWGNEELVTFLKKQRDLYGYLHDQTLRLANRGYTMLEIAELMEIPEALSQEWYNRGYHGTYNHNIKAVYQKYLGWYDGNPANLHPLPPEAAAKKYVEYMGGADAVIKRAKADFDKGDYRWVMQVLMHVVYADPSNMDARNLMADASEQLGYQSEAGTWRGWYLSAAKDLREGVAAFARAGLGPADTWEVFASKLHYHQGDYAEPEGFRSLAEDIDTTTPAGRMLMQMVGSFAEFERAMIRERTHAGLAQARAEGRIGGRRHRRRRGPHCRDQRCRQRHGDPVDRPRP